MHCLNYRVGVLFRENFQKKSYEMRYFFLDDEGSLYYVTSLARLQKVIRLSSDFKQIRVKLQQMGEKNFSLTKYQVGAPRNYATEAILPFSNRTCIDIREKEGKDERGYQLFGLIDEDTPLLYDEILRLTGRKKVEQKQRKSVIEDEKKKQEAQTMKFFERYIAREERFKMSRIGQGEIEFQGDMEPKEASGKGVQTLIKEGITYTGYFHNGQKNGVGLLVSESLDSLDCQFLDDQLVGI